MLKVEDLHVKVMDKEILRGITLSIGEGELHVVMGPNGSGKSTLALTIAGHPRYKVSSGRIIFAGRDITKMKPEERARNGIFLSFQHPVEVEGVKVLQFLQRVLKNLRGVDEVEAYEIIFNAVEELGFDSSILSRELNVGFSGGERKKLEMLQAYLVRPKLLILDEPDSGVDVDSLKVIAGVIAKLHSEGTAILLITHYGRILEYLNPQRVHVLKEGKLVASGGVELVKLIEEKGFAAVEENGTAVKA
ncbi:Fe-S cluster assembly ATPase SufC [Thermococcus barophilus]|uniref:ATP-dependent transporter ycf16 n=2 Tax=Thermococcus barophilus TaxID=55802 RepID=A0A0S1XCU3_THEBA|nr:Fe-S cluster assembly ATPase SufC [Thermococcus barophilus]ADT84394.1 Fe-S cluster assembly ATPase SufC-like protein [Thermococcus barophilus MP]ALM75588.1 ATP-dependent transporter ycf16 [Thermococcus barophilus]